MASRFCGHCGTPAAPGSLFCISCGHPLELVDNASVATGPPAAPATAPPGPSPTPPSMAGPAPWGYWPPPPQRRKTRTILVVAVIAIVVIVILAVVVILTTQTRASFVNITKSGDSGSSAFSNVTIRTSGAAIDVDRLHVDLRSVRSGATFDEIEYYNLEQIPAGTVFIWDLDIGIDPFDEPSFTYVFTLEVNGALVDSSTVT
ncbi:MAG: zinc ribbon domain-containing protein [Thermoplasmata archaeon]